jgi:uncharacterized repeat protein (TIGR03803 family)
VLVHFYGTTVVNGPSNGGTVFQMSLDGTVTVPRVWQWSRWKEPPRRPHSGV